MLDVPTASEPAETPPAEIQKPVAAIEPAPQAEEPAAAPVIQPQTAEKAGEDVVALAPIPDLAPQADVPAAAPPAETAKPKLADGEMIRDCATCPELVVVNAGRFAMGEGSEGLEHQVSVTSTQEVTIAAPFAIGRTEITFDEWSQCVGDGGCTSQPADENWGRGRRPVINVSFNDITQQYLPWLSRKTGFTYRLPTEAEWEFAARGGASAPAGQAYSFGNDGTLLCQYGNSSDGDRRHLQRRICHNGAGGLAESKCARPFRHAWQRVGVDGRLLATAVFRQSSKAGRDMHDARAARRLVGQQSRSAAFRRPGLGEPGQEQEFDRISRGESAAVNIAVCKGEHAVKKRTFISLSLISLSLVLFALFLSVASATPAGAQGMISAESEETTLPTPISAISAR